MAWQFVKCCFTFNHFKFFPPIYIIQIQWICFCSMSTNKPWNLINKIQIFTHFETFVKCINVPRTPIRNNHPIRCLPIKLIQNLNNNSILSFNSQTIEQIRQIIGNSEVVSRISFIQPSKSVSMLKTIAPFKTDWINYAVEILFAERNTMEGLQLQHNKLRVQLRYHLWKHNRLWRVDGSFSEEKDKLQIWCYFIVATKNWGEYKKMKRGL